MKRILVALAFLCLLTEPSQAQESVPGDACSTADQTRWAGGVETSGVGYYMVCQGGVWVRAIETDTAGNVGVKRATPATALDVAGAVKVDYDATACAASIQGAIRYDSGGTALNYCDATTWQTIASSAGGGLWTVGTGDAIYYNSGSAQVGIGTNAPDVSLDIAYAGGTEDTDPARIDLANTTAQGSAVLGLYEGADKDTGFTIRNWSSADSVTNELRFYGHSNSAGGDLHMSIDRDTGNVLINNSGSDGKLTIRGKDGVYDPYINFDTGNAGEEWSVGLDDADSQNFKISQSDSLGTNDMFVIERSTGNVGIGDTTPDVALDVVGDINYTGVIQDVSDRRLKENITALNGQLANIKALKPVSFTMKDDNKSVIEYGLIAQDVEAVYPALVGTDKDEMATKSMNYMGLIAPMIAAMQEQQAQIEALQEEVRALRALHGTRPVDRYNQ